MNTYPISDVGRCVNVTVDSVDYTELSRIDCQAESDIWQMDSLEALRVIQKYTDFMTSICRVRQGRSRNKVKIMTLEERYRA